MRQSISGHTIFNANQMVRQLDQRPVVLIESDADLSVLGHHLLDEEVRCAPAFSKSATVVAARLHRENDDDWVIAVVDRDLDDHSDKNVIATGHYDLEAEIFFVHMDRVTRYVYSHMVSEEIDHSTARLRGEEAIGRSEKLATAIGVMREHAHTARLGVSLNGLPLIEIFNRDDAGDFIASTALVACMRAKALGLQPELETKARSVIGSGRQLARLCNGHDLVMSLCMFIGLESGHRPNPRDFARGLHVTIDCSRLQALSIYAPLRTWLLQLNGAEIWDCVAA